MSLIDIQSRLSQIGSRPKAELDAVVLDANAIVSDWYFEGYGFEVLRNLAAENLVHIIVPWLVVEEVVAHFERQTFSKDTVRALKPALDETVLAQVRTPGWYRAKLASQLSTLGAHIESLPGGGHEQVVRRLLSCRRPFKRGGDERASDEGYKDTLLWLSVLDVVRRGHSVVHFVTRDKEFWKDGAVPKDSTSHGQSPLADPLHPDLKAEVNALGGPAATVKLWPNVASLERGGLSDLLVRADEEVRLWASDLSRRVALDLEFEGDQCLQVDGDESWYDLVGAFGPDFPSHSRSALGVWPDGSPSNWGPSRVLSVRLLGPGEFLLVAERDAELWLGVQASEIALGEDLALNRLVSAVGSRVKAFGTCVMTATYRVDPLRFESVAFYWNRRSTNGAVFAAQVSTT